MLNRLQKLIDVSRGRTPKADGAAPPPGPPGRGRKRGFSRHRVQVPAMVQAGSRVVAGISGSLGLGGLFLSCPEPFPPETPVTVELIPPQRGVPAIRAPGAVAYAGAGGMGIRFTGLSQADCRQLRDLFAYASRIRAR